MKNIFRNFVKNSYIQVVDDSNTFSLLLKESLKKIDKNLKLKEKTYFHVEIKYPKYWPEDLDLFKYLDKKTISNIRKKRCYFIFDASTEGFSPFITKWFDVLYYTCEINKISTNQIIFVSSNLKDDDNIKNYCKVKNKKSINVFTLPMFENSCRTDGDIKNLLERSINKTNKHFKDKYFSSLSRLNRHHRSAGTFLLCQSPVKNQALISHNRLDKRDCYFIDDITLNTTYTEKEVIDWLKTLPLIIDYDDFNVNWAMFRNYKHIHNQTIFQIVNETQVDNFNETSLFYSEKTFKPILCFQPFVIYGQKGCNRFLKNLGYKTYDDWFDLSFDEENNFIQRYKKLLLVVEDTCKYLDSLTRNQKIDWKFKNTDILVHNIKTMNSRRYTLEKLKKFLLELENQIISR